MLFSNNSTNEGIVDSLEAYPPFRWNNNNVKNREKNAKYINHSLLAKKKIVMFGRQLRHCVVDVAFLLYTFLL